MSTLTRSIALVTGAAVLAVPTAVLVSSPANADVERRGACGGGVYDFSVDREDGGLEVSADLDGLAPGARWKVVLKHDGKRIYKQARTADNEGEIDVDRFRSNTAGKDTFRFRAVRVSDGASCSSKITVR